MMNLMVADKACWLRAQPIFDTFDKLNVTKPRVILLDPAGRTFDQAYAEELAQEEELVFICGHYEGYDERIKTLVTDEISLGGLCLDWGRAGCYDYCRCHCPFDS